MFDTPRRLHYASILLGGITYVKQALWPIVLAVFAGSRGRDEPFFFMMLAGAGLGLFGLVGPAIGYFFTSYVIRDDSLIVNSGWLWKKTRVIPLARIQNVNLRQNMLHRLVNASSVMVETAAGAGVEAELSAVSLDDAQLLQTALMRRKAEIAPVKQEIEPVLYELTTRMLLIAGALNNRLMYIIAGLVGAVQFGDISRNLFGPIANWLEKLSPLHAAMIAMAGFVGLIFLGWIFSVAYSLSRFYGFRMVRHPKGLQLKYGLFTKIESIVPTGRVQTLRIGQPLFYQWFGFCEIFADTAGSFDAKEMGAANKLCPITELEEIDTIGSIVFPNFRFSSFQWKSVSKKAIYRYFMSDVLVNLVVLMPVATAFLSWYGLILPGILIPLSYLMASLRHRYVGYAEQYGFIAARRGFWRRDVIAMPLDRTQIIAVNQSFFQKRWKLADVAIMSSAPQGIVKIENLDFEIAIELQERLSIEGQNRRMAWKGGN
jgi:putative membrane protein